MEGELRLGHGRRLAYLVRGPDDGFPVVAHNGTPGSRLGRHPDPAIYETTGLRWIAYDRPGHGRSDPAPGRDVAAAAADVRALADALGLERFGVFGVSGGGPHALATAALLPDRVERVAVFVGVAPPDDPELDFHAGMTELNLAEFGAAEEGEEALAAFLADPIEAIRSDPLALVEMLRAELPEPDREVLARPEVLSLVLEDVVEAVREGGRGWIDDDLAFVRPWGFAPEDVRAETRLWHGELDVLAPAGHSRRLAERIPGAHLEIVPGAGHLLVDLWPEAFAWLAGRNDADGASV
jgi:pimeloyl-ACP methyl ester carboxylesterase